MATRRVHDSTTVKVRDSCQACAASKVKCQKERPKCSRCFRRGETCEYFVSKRPGRKRGKTQPNNEDSSRGAVDERGPAPLGNDHLATLQLSPPPSRPSSMSETTTGWSPGTFTGSLMPLDSALDPLLEGSSDIFDAFLASPVDFLEMDPGEPMLDISEPVSAMSSSDRYDSTPPTPASHDQVMLNGAMSANGAPDASSCCLMHALDLMRRLSSAKEAACLNSSLQSLDGTASQATSTKPSLAQTVVQENEQTIEIVSNMLQCPCAKDSYLLTVLAMIVFKVLERYAAAARGRLAEADLGTGGAAIPESASNLGRESEENRGRLAAQLILGELHRVQRLVNVLSPKFKVGGAETPRNRGSGMEQATPLGDAQMLSFADSAASAGPFSSTILEQVERDLRRALSALSSEIIHTLRQS